MTKISKEQAEEAVKLLIAYIGDDPSREGLVETPSRVVKSYLDLFCGYGVKTEEILDKRFQEINKFDDVILLKNVGFSSFCEHHILPFWGTVDIAYIPNGSVVGISKIARLVDAFARRLQIQESMTAQIAETIQEHLSPRGTAVRVSAQHSCMTLRGVMKEKSVMETVHFTGCFKNNKDHRLEFWKMIG